MSIYKPIKTFPGGVAATIQEGRSWLRLYRTREPVKCPCCDRTLKPKRLRSVS